MRRRGVAIVLGVITVVAQSRRPARHWSWCVTPISLRLVRPGRALAHPVKVAELLLAGGAPTNVIVVGLMHDVLEDTRVTRAELHAVCGPAVARLVDALTEDPSIARYAARKTALRARILDAGPDAAMVSVADKLAKLQGASVAPRPRKLRLPRDPRRGGGALWAYGPGPTARVRARPLHLTRRRSTASSPSGKLPDER
jgi:HD domain